MDALNIFFLKISSMIIWASRKLPFENKTGASSGPDFFELPALPTNLIDFFAFLCYNGWQVQER